MLVSFFIFFFNAGVNGSARLIDIAVGTAVGALLLLVSVVVITFLMLFLYLKKLKREREKNSFNLTPNPAYTEDDSTQFNSVNVTANVNPAYNIHPVPHLRALERDVWSHPFQHGQRELRPLPMRGIALNMNQNFAYTLPGLPVPPELGVLPAAIREPQNPDLEEDNYYESIT